jgi:hypothetical protein
MRIAAPTVHILGYAGLWREKRRAPPRRPKNRSRQRPTVPTLISRHPVPWGMVRYDGLTMAGHAKGSTNVTAQIVRHVPPPSARYRWGNVRAVLRAIGAFHSPRPIVLPMLQPSCNQHLRVRCSWPGEMSPLGRPERPCQERIAVFSGIPLDSAREGDPPSNSRVLQVTRM